MNIACVLLKELSAIESGISMPSRWNWATYLRNSKAGSSPTGISASLNALKVKRLTRLVITIFQQFSEPKRE